MPSFSLTNPSSSSSSVGSSLGSIHRTVIAYAQLLFPPSFYDFVPFLLAGLMALLFTALLVFLVEDSEDAYPHTPSRLANSRSTSTVDKGKRPSRRLVGLAEQDNEAAEHGTDDEESSLAWDPRTDAQTTDGDLKMSAEWNRVQKEKMALSGYRYRITTNPKLLASPPPSASPQSSTFTPPILSMAKLIMHRHDQSSKRARATSSRPSPPPSPPACTASGSGSGSFGPMQYTLKSAAIKDIKVSLVAFPSSEDSDVESESLSSTPSSSPLSPVFPSLELPTSTADSENKAQLPNLSTCQPPSPTISGPLTRHARSRSIAQLPHPSLIPALQHLQDQQPSTSSERTIRRRPSSTLEEGGVPAQLEPSMEPSSSPPQTVLLLPLSEAKKTHRSRKHSKSAGKRAHGHQRTEEPLEGLAALEEGSR